MSAPSTALFAVRVLTYQGRIEYADEDLVSHLREISKRYEELKGENDFQTAGLTAKSEWLDRYIAANVPVSGGTPSAKSDCYAGDCTTCGGPVFHRKDKPGEYDHKCREHNAESEVS